MIADALEAIAATIDDATIHGSAEAVAGLTDALGELAEVLEPLAEVLAHPENREHLARWLAWIQANGAARSSPPAEVTALADLLAAVEVL